MKTEPPPAELGIAQINTLRAAQAFLRHLRHLKKRG